MDVVWAFPSDSSRVSCLRCKSSRMRHSCQMDSQVVQTETGAGTLKHELSAECFWNRGTWESWMLKHDVHRGCQIQTLSTWLKSPAIFHSAPRVFPRCYDRPSDTAGAQRCSERPDCSQRRGLWGKASWVSREPDKEPHWASPLQLDTKAWTWSAEVLDSMLSARHCSDGGDSRHIFLGSKWNLQEKVYQHGRRYRWLLFGQNGRCHSLGSCSLRWAGWLGSFVAVARCSDRTFAWCRTLLDDHLARRAMPSPRRISVEGDSLVGGISRVAIPCSRTFRGDLVRFGGDQLLALPCGNVVPGSCARCLWLYRQTDSGTAPCNLGVGCCILVRRVGVDLLHDDVLWNSVHPPEGYADGSKRSQHSCHGSFACF